MSIRTLVWLNPLVFAIAGLIYAEDVPVARPTPPGPVSSSASSSTTTTHVVRSKLQPQSVTVALIDGTKLSGELTEVDQWNMKTSFGTTNLPLSTVAGIRMAQEGNAMTTVVLHNGDNLTGAVQIDLVVIQTEWGRAEIQGNHVASILFTPGLKWINEAGLNGMRWKLVTDEPPRPAPAAGQPGARPGTPGQPQLRPGVQPVFQPGIRQ
jgi:hypothetical protein